MCPNCGSSDLKDNTTMDDPCPVVLCGNCGKQGSQIEMESSPEFEPDDTPSLFQRFTRRVKNLFAR